MALIQISEKEIDTLYEWNNAGKAAEVWRYLGNKGDAYAFLAAAVVSGNTCTHAECIECGRAARLRCRA